MHVLGDAKLSTKKSRVVVDDPLVSLNVRSSLCFLFGPVTCTAWCKQIVDGESMKNLRDIEFVSPERKKVRLLNFCDDECLSKSHCFFLLYHLYVTVEGRVEGRFQSFVARFATLRRVERADCVWRVRGDGVHRL
mgnify:CR=1 FL=1